MYSTWGAPTEKVASSRLNAAPQTPTRPIGIDGLSPQADDIVFDRRSSFGLKTASPCSPIGTDSSGAFFMNSPPQHILGLFSPSKSSDLIRSLTLSPSGKSPVIDAAPPVGRSSRSPGPVDVDDVDFSLPPAAISEHEEFLLGMGGMDDLDAEDMYGSPRSARAACSPRVSTLSLPTGTPLGRSPPIASGSPFSTFSTAESSDRGLMGPTTGPLAVSPQPSSTAQPGSASGEHPYGEHPSRTLFVRNINSSIDDEELRNMFEKFGPIRSMYTQCKHRGFVMISYYDIRDSKDALKSLQSTILRRRKLDIHFSIPKDNPSEKDQNQGTLVVFNLDPSITNEDLRVIFGSHGEIKEIRETPNKKHHKFIEFYDVRHAEQAMRALNKTEIRSKKIKIEHSRPGGLRKPGGSPTPTGSHTTPPSHAAHSSPGAVEDFAAFAYLSAGTQTTYVPGGSSRIESPPFTNNWLTPIGTSPRKPMASSSSIPHGYGENLAQSYPPQEATAFTRPSHHYSTPFLSTSYTPMYSSPVSQARGVPISLMNSTWGVEMSSSVPSPISVPGQAYQSNSYSGQPRSLPSDSNEAMRKQSSKQRQGRGSRSQHNEQFILNLDSVLRGLDIRTTLMIKNIPNKYTQKMLLSTINQYHHGHYDFFYLPIDFKNKCNVGYAFINFVSITHIPSFYEKLHNTKWSKFNSEKVCKITYARIQGKEALVDHFRNSTLLSEDKKCRPIIFHSEGPQAGQQAAFPLPSGGRREHRRDDRHKRK